MIKTQQIRLWHATAFFYENLQYNLEARNNKQVARVTNPKIRVKLENTYSEENHVVKRVPQGSVLSCACLARY